MKVERWRVPLEGGEVCEALVTPWWGFEGGYVGSVGDGDESVDTWKATPREAVVGVAEATDWPVRQVLAPGDRTVKEA